jgi:phosphoribosylamine--glycine ligase
MKILIIGNGGREHALAWKIAQSTQVNRVFVAPGNAGTAQEPKVENITIKADNLSALVDFAQHNAIDLTIVGPEVPLVLGIVDAFSNKGLSCFGPSKNAAQLEGSKQFAKDFLSRHHIPTARYQSFTELESAVAYIQQMGTPMVIKADGLAAGKGVVIAETETEAIEIAQSMLVNNVFGQAGQRIVIEEFLPGEEASFICLVDGEHILPLATSQDHKPRDNGDKGPNTGGMGAYSPAPIITEALHHRIMTEIITPTVQGMAVEGQPYRGFLYAGLMIDQQGNPKVLEYNCRLGDPETQPILLRLRSDLVDLCLAAMSGTLQTVQAEWDVRTALGVVLASQGYPGRYETGHIIKGLAEATAFEGKVFHAGTLEIAGQTVTAGGRVLCACSLGNSVREAQTKAYQLVKQINWPSVYYRTDIGYRAIN